MVALDMLCTPQIRATGLAQIGTVPAVAPSERGTRANLCQSVPGVWHGYGKRKYLQILYYTYIEFFFLARARVFDFPPSDIPPWLVPATSHRVHTLDKDWTS